MTENTAENASGSDQKKVNGVPLSNAPVPSNPQIPTVKKGSKKDTPIETPATANQVNYDVPPADQDAANQN
ncbi:hypothetical protein [Bifidobacterium aquikefiricola]|uniref:Levansucrase n=1 Tax=Bifidobacterium aquikefiricola TaxID=3059038 RepID=A0AB39U5Z9_9BIFI